MDESQKHYPEWKPETKYYIKHGTLQKKILIYSDRKHIRGHLELEDINYQRKGTRKLLGGLRNILYLNCGGCFMGTYICHNLSKYTLKLDGFYCM